MKKFSDITYEKAYRTIDHIAQALKRNPDQNRVVYYADGLYGKKRLLDILNKHDLDVVYLGDFRPGFYRFIPLPYPTQFLVKINNIDELPKFYRDIEDPTTGILYVFDKGLEEKFVKEYKFNSDEHYIMDNIKPLLDGNYLMYSVDRDNRESSTDVLEYVEYGDKLPRELKWFL